MIGPIPQDIEIYVAGISGQQALDWLAGRFPDHESARPAGKRQWRQRLHHDGKTLPVLVIEDAAPGFTSIWFDSPPSPWPTDLDCAQEAFQHFQREILITAGSWQEGGDPDAWLSISSGGQGQVHWPG
jgi:hypothetical protein